MYKCKQIAFAFVKLTETAEYTEYDVNISNVYIFNGY